MKSTEALRGNLPLPRVQKVEGKLKSAADWKKLAKEDVVLTTVQSASRFLKGVPSHRRV